MYSRVEASKAYFIKLGREGRWEDDCLREGILRIGYAQVPHLICLQGDWEAVRQFLKNEQFYPGVPQFHATQIRIFYEAREDTVFITFAHGCMHWCQPSGPVEVLPNGERQRGTVAGWNSANIAGTPLAVARLSGELRQVQMFKGTICQVKPFDYLLRKLNNELSPELMEEDRLRQEYIRTTINLMRQLTWQDFEFLVEQVFSKSGYKLLNKVGGPQKTVDLELMLPATNERAFVQVKSQADQSSFRDYAKRFAKMDVFDRMFFVWHTGDLAEDDHVKNIELVGPTRLAEMILDAGLMQTLRDKVS